MITILTVLVALLATSGSEAFVPARFGGVSHSTTNSCRSSALWSAVAEETTVATSTKLRWV